MDKSAVDGLYPLLSSVAHTLPSLLPASQIDICASSNKMVIMECEGKSEIPAKFAEIVQCKEKLSKYLPIYNGLVYMNEGTET